MRRYLFPALAVLHLILGVMYLYWRCTAGLGGSLTLSILFLLAEGFMLVASVGFSLSQLYTAPSFRPTYDQLTEPSSDPPYVDVLVVRRWDSLTATQQTATAALTLDYPWHRLFVHILDLESDETIAEGAKAIPCEYLSCPGSTLDPLQYALEEVSTFGEFILLLEPGQLPDPHLLKATIPYFYDARNGELQPNRTGYVQTRLQVLGRSMPDHPLQQLIPMGVTGGEAAPLLGTGVVLRREAIKNLESIDTRHPVLLGCLIHRAGWRSHFCPDAQVSGALFPLRNRRIALLSVMQALRYNPIFAGSTTQTQRFQYLWLAFWSISGLASLMGFCIPVIFFWTGMTPVPDFDLTFLEWFLPYAGVGRLAWLASFPPQDWKSAWQAERQMGAQFFQSLQALVQSLWRQVPYRERPSQLSLWPQILMIFLTLASLVVGGIRLSHGWTVSWIALAVGGFWAVYNLLLLTVRPPGFEADGALAAAALEGDAPTQDSPDPES